MYDDIIKRIGGFALYQKVATFLVICSFSLYYAQFYALSWILL